MLTGGGYGNGVIEVWYDPRSHIVQVWTYTAAQDWVQRGSDIPVTFANGDRFGAAATASGQVKVYQNSTLLATVDVTAWRYSAQGGSIGLWMINATGTIMDDFGGGTRPLAYRPGKNIFTVVFEAIRSFFQPRTVFASLGGGEAMVHPVEQKEQARPAAAAAIPPAGQVWRSYYYAGGQRIAMREATSANPTGQVKFLLSDHLGSTSVVTDGNGANPVRQLYKPWGEPRPNSSILPTAYKFTGQREMAGLGLYFYQSRFYDPLLGRWTQPDTLIPNPGNVLDWDRYAYVRANPIRYDDPSGHNGCDEDGNCFDNQGWHPARGKHFSVEETWRKIIWSRYGVNMSNDGGKDWDKANLQLMFNSLTKIDNHLNGHLRSMVVGSTFWLSKHPDSGGEYNGSTNTIPPSGITFFTKSTQALRQQNIFHEVGHLLDNVRGIWDVFTNAVANEVNPCWVASDDKINPDALLGLYLQNDPNYASVEARQTYSHFGSSEQWADAFANYVAGNINLGSTAGTDMYNFVTGALAPYIGNP